MRLISKLSKVTSGFFVILEEANEGLITRRPYSTAQIFEIFVVVECVIGAVGH